MYTSTAELYDCIYASIKDFAVDATDIAARIRKENPAASTVLDVACGTAEHARILTEEHGLRVDGLDLDHANIVEGDMTSFDMGRRYDVVMCLFSSIGYVRTLDNVRRTLERFRAHLADGGVVLVEPWFPPGFLQVERTFLNVVVSEGLKIARMSRTEVEGRISRTCFEYLIGRAGKIERASEVHELGLFTVEEMLEAFEHAGLAAVHSEGGPSGRGLFTARALRR